VGEIYGAVAREYGSTAPFDEIQAAFVRQFRHSGPLSTPDEKRWWRDLVHRVFAEVGMIRDFNRFFEKVYDQFRDSRGWMLFPETCEVLTELQQRGLRLGVISNFDSRVYSVMRDLRIRDYFQAVIISSETGYAKPDPEIFSAAVRALKSEPQNILLVGDSLADDVLASRRVGMRSILIDRTNRYAGKDVQRIDNLRDVF